MPGLTPSQTVGPYLHIGLRWPDGPYAVEAGDAAAIRIEGFVLDGDGDVVPDAMIETWQSTPDPDERFRGFARCETDDEGGYFIVTRKPGPVTSDGQTYAPHLVVSVFARGLLHRVVTRICFADEPAANAADPVLTRIAADRRGTLLAEPASDCYRFDIRLQGPDETVFFDI